MTKSATSYIEEHEEAEAVRLIKAQFKEMTKRAELPRPCGSKIAVKIYVRPEEIGDTGLILPDSVRAGDKWTNCVGLVCGMGQDAYSGKDQFGNERFPTGPWCKIGDWVVFPRYESQVFSWRGVAMMTIYDDAVQMVVDDPSEVLAGHKV